MNSTGVANFTCSGKEVSILSFKLIYEVNGEFPDVHFHVFGSLLSTLNCNGYCPYCVSICAVHLKEPHSIMSVPCRASCGTIEMVNSSTGAESVWLVILAMPRLREALYSVPLCPVCLFTIRSTPPVCGMVHNVYVPAGICMRANLIGADVVNCVAAFAPVRHTRS